MFSKFAYHKIGVIINKPPRPKCLRLCKMFLRAVGLWSKPHSRQGFPSFLLLVLSYLTFCGVFFAQIYQRKHCCRWWTGPWQHCSVTCGTNGVHQRTVICVRSLGEDEQIALDDEACIADEKPPEMESCNKKEPCPGNSTWIVGEWSSVSC